MCIYAKKCKKNTLKTCVCAIFVVILQSQFEIDTFYIYILYKQ